MASDTVKQSQESVKQPEVPVSDSTGQKVDESVHLEGQKTPAEKKMLKKLKFSNNKQTASLVLGAFLVVIAGIGTGWVFSGGVGAGDSRGSGQVEVPGAVESKTEAGIEDESAFPDSAEGILEEEGIEGEGTHHLVREGGPTKYVYLTSTVIDLESFKGKTVQVWGETVSAKTAGWLMDVGKIKVIE